MGIPGWAILTLNLNGSTTRVDFDRYLYPLSSRSLKVARLPDNANNMTIAEAIKAERIEAEAGNVKAARKLQVRIQEKFTFPMACVVFDDRQQSRFATGLATVATRDSASTSS